MNDIDRMWKDNQIGSWRVAGMSLGRGRPKERLWAGLIFEEGTWSIHKVKASTTTAQVGWRSIISHDCDLNGSPYWMLIEYHDRKTCCMYCDEAMPDSIIALFKFHNEDMIT